MLFFKQSEGSSSQGVSFSEFKLWLSQRSDFTEVIYLAEKNPIINEYCLRDELAPFWNDLLVNPEKLGASLALNYLHPQLMPQPGINSFNLLRGVFYNDHGDWLFHESSDNATRQQGLQYLSQAEKYGSFHAVLTLNSHDLERIKQKINAQTDDLSSKQIQHIMARVERSARLHGTLGYILCANTCSCLAEYHQQVVGGDVATSASYFLVLQHLYTALYLQNVSGAAIDNVCGGRGITAYQFLGCADLSSIIKKGQEQVMAGFNDINVLNRARDNAKRVAQGFLASHIDTGLSLGACP